MPDRGSNWAKLYLTVAADTRDALATLDRRSYSLSISNENQTALPVGKNQTDLFLSMTKYLQ